MICEHNLVSVFPYLSTRLRPHGVIYQLYTMGLHMSLGAIDEE